MKWLPSTIFIKAGVLLVAALMACRYLATYSWLAELTTHLTVYYAVCLLIAVIIFLVRNERKWILPSFLLFLICSVIMGRVYMPSEVQRSAAYEDISIMQFNVNYSNSESKTIAGWINNFDTISKDITRQLEVKAPDILVLQEMSLELATNLADVIAYYPYKLVAPKKGAFGVVILSKMEITRSTREHFPDSWNEHTQLELRTPKLNIPFSFFEVHTKPPVTPSLAVSRNSELHNIAEKITQDKTQHKILIGDLNVTPYSPYFDQLEKNSGLSSAMRAYRVPLGTWPSFLPIMRIPIDHLLVSSNIEILQRDIGANMGSDHMPVFTTVRIWK